MRNRESKNKLLVELERSQCPSDDFIRGGKWAAQEIFKALQSTPGISVDRVLIAGSIGKRSSLGDEFSPDFDLVIFLNNYAPPFPSEVIDSFVKAVETHLAHNLIPTKLRMGKYSIGFGLNVEGQEYQFDVLPAANLVTCIAPGEKKHSNQAGKVRCLMNQAEDNDCGYRYSTSLAEQTVLFMKSRPEPTIQCIRIAKYWNHKIDLKDMYISGRSYLMELIVTKANSGRKTGREGLLITRFMRFLEMITRLDSLKIVFQHTFPLSKIPKEILEQVPLVIDPVNPHNNLAAGLIDNPDAILKFQRCARMTLSRFNNVHKIDDIDAVFDFSGIV